LVVLSGGIHAGLQTSIDSGAGIEKIKTGSAASLYVSPAPAGAGVN
jgi:hypothetical protein